MFKPERLKEGRYNLSNCFSVVSAEICSPPSWPIFEKYLATSVQNAPLSLFCCSVEESPRPRSCLSSHPMASLASLDQK